MATALAYVVSADMRRPYYVYIGLQDNGSWGGPSAVRGRGGIMNSHWFGIGGGDGFYTAVDPTDHNIVFTESQDGATNRYDLAAGGRGAEHPAERRRRRGGGGGGGGAWRRRRRRRPSRRRRGVGARRHPRRRRCRSADRAAAAAAQPNVLNAVAGRSVPLQLEHAVHLSPHNPKIVWLGGNRLFKSYNQGDTWVASEDLTKKIDRSTDRGDGSARATSRSCRRTTASSPTARSSRSRNRR